jgi:hypothetical protein
MFYFSLMRNLGKQLIMVEWKLQKLLFLQWVVMALICFSRLISIAIMVTVEQSSSICYKLMVYATPLLVLYVGMMLLPIAVTL